MILTFLFILLIFVILLSYVYYPYWIKNLSEKDTLNIMSDTTIDPEVTIIFSCYNEDKILLEKIENIQLLDYPKEKLKVLIGSDGSTDQTPIILSKIANDQFSVFIFPEQRGKIHVISDLVKYATTDIIVFCDANSMFQLDAIKNIVKHYADDRIGGVCGKLILKQNKNNLNYESKYWDFESRIKYWEGKAGICIGANGAIFSIKKDYFLNYIPSNMFTDDLVFGLNVLIKGKNFIYEKDAIAFETESSSLKSEIKRKMRIGRSNLSSFRYISGWRKKLSPQAKKAFIYHKILRWLIPILIAVVFLFSLYELQIFSMISIMVVTIHVFVLLEYVLETFLKIKTPFKSVAYILLMNYGLLFGYIQYLFGKNKPYWNSTLRN